MMTNIFGKKLFITNMNIILKMHYLTVKQKHFLVPESRGTTRKEDEQGRDRGGRRSGGW